MAELLRRVLMPGIRAVALIWLACCLLVAGAAFGAPLLPNQGVIAYSAEVARNGILLQPGDIYLLDIARERRHNLTRSPRSGDFRPRWTADGDVVIYISYGGIFTEGMWCAQRLSGALACTPLGDRTNTNPLWSPDGSVGIYTTTLSSGIERLALINADGTGARLLRPEESPGGDYHPDWSPDGRQIAFASTLAGSWDIYVIDVDGENLRLVFDSPAFEDHPVWRPDGRAIAFLSSIEGSNQIYLVEITEDGFSEPRRLTELGADHGMPAWRP
jgi:Tol biopolymer transport system component